MSAKNLARLVLLGILWGTSYSWVKVAVAELNPVVLVGFRTLLGSLGLFVFLQFGKKGQLNWREITPFLGVFVLLGLFNVALPFSLISWSEVYIDSGMTSILMSTSPLFTVLVASFFLPEERFSLPRLAGLLVGFGGVVLLILPAAGRGVPYHVAGYAAALLASFSYAAAGVYARKKTEGPSSVVQAFLQLSMAAAWLWTFIVLTRQPVHLPSALRTWAAIAWLGLLGSTLAYILFFSLLHSVGATRTSLVSYITPLVAVVLGIVFLTERLQWQSLVGGALIISGIAVVNYKGGASPPPGPA